MFSRFPTEVRSIVTFLHSNNVVLVEDDDLVATSIASVMRSRGYVVTPFHSGEELIANSQTQPDGCMIIDIDLGPLKMTGLELLRWMRSQSWTIPVIVLSGKVTVPEVVEALKETVVDIISKPPSVPRLMSAIEISLSGASSASRQDVAKLRGSLQSLTETERSVLSMLLSGASNKMIASRLDLGLRSAVRYRKAILDTFGLSTVPELASTLGAAGISLTELAVPPVFTPGIPQQHREEIQNQLRLLHSMLAKVDLSSTDSLHSAVLNAKLELERIANLSCLASPKPGSNNPSVMILTADLQVGGLLRDLLQSHGLFAEACNYAAEATISQGGGAAAPPDYIIGFESPQISMDHLRSLKNSLGIEAAKMIVISSEMNSPDRLENADFVMFSSPVSGQRMVQYILDDLVGNT